jgi:hypothetical protein
MIAACAERISQVVRSSTRVNEDAWMVTSGKMPNMSAAELCDLLPPRMHERLDAAMRLRISSALQERLRLTRSRLKRQYTQMVGRYHSMNHLGMTDAELEDSLVGIFEMRYQKSLADIRVMLAKLLAHYEQGSTENRNTRGGFGDVSPPLHSTKANIQRTLQILETAFNHTKSPLATEIDHLARLTSLEPHQVRPPSQPPYSSFFAYWS